MSSQKDACPPTANEAQADASVSMKSVMIVLLFVFAAAFFLDKTTASGGQTPGRVRTGGSSVDRRGTF